MARGIIALEEYTDSSDPNELDFSSFESVISGDADEITGGLETALDTIDDVEQHRELTNIIATEGYGNRPEIARIALASIETRLFGKPMVATRVGTESRTRIATEGKNVFVRAWQAIVKFLKNLWKKIKSFFGADSEKKSKKKKKDIDDAKVDAAAKAIDNVDDSAIESDSSAPTQEKQSKPESSVIKMMKAMRTSKEMFGYDGRKLHGPKEILGPSFKKITAIPSLLDSEAKKVTFELEEGTFKILDDAMKNTDYKVDGKDVSGSSSYSDKDTGDLAKYIEEQRVELNKAIQDTFGGTFIPGMVGVVGGGGGQIAKVTTVHNYQDIMRNNITATWLKEQAKYLLDNKALVSKGYGEIMSLQRELLKHGERINKLSDKLEKIINSSDFTNDTNDKLVVGMANVSVKNLISWYQSLIFAGTAIVKFGDTAHRLIMMCDESYTQGDPNYVK